MNVLSLQLICFTHKSIFTQSSNDFVIIRYNLSGLTLNPNGIFLIAFILKHIFYGFQITFLIMVDISN